MRIFDLHTHTNYSDGLYSPKELINKAKTKGLNGIAITDHDTIGGIPEASEYINELKNFQIIPGIEFGASCSGDEVHILGYFIDINNKDLLNVLSKIKSSRWDRGIAILDKLINLNIILPKTDIIKEAKEKGFIGRANIARKMVEYKYVETINEAFEKYLDVGKPAYVERYQLAIKETIDLIHKSGGVSVLAHPGLIKDQTILEKCLNYGIMGIECYQSKHTEIQAKKYLNFCKKHNLIATGGSDYHGDEDILGDYTIDIDLIEIFKERI
ncbi:MAG: PHP domain-containing protein [Gudongella sp.]|nr:PHP domain-containing protein [Gudongella sp.]